MNMDKDPKKIPNYTDGSQTPYGVVTRILGKEPDSIVFLNEDGIPKVVTNRSDEVYHAVRNRSIQLSTDAGRKFQGVHQETIDQIIGLCMASALKAGVKLEDLDKFFQPARDFIENEKPIKKLIGSGSEYKYRVFIDHAGNLGWECGKPLSDRHLSSQLTKIDRLSRLANSQIHGPFRKDITGALAAAVIGLINSIDKADRESIVESASFHTTRKVREYHHAWYFLILIASATVIGTSVDFFSQDSISPEWIWALFGGILGSVISSLQRTKTDHFDLTQSRTNVVVQAISRILLGAASGLIVVVASKSGLAFGIIDGNYYGIALVSIGAGFSERFIPDILSLVVSDTKTK